MDASLRVARVIIWNTYYSVQTMGQSMPQAVALAAGAFVMPMLSLSHNCCVWLVGGDGLGICTCREALSVALLYGPAWAEAPATAFYAQGWPVGVSDEVSMVAVAALCVGVSLPGLSFKFAAALPFQTCAVISPVKVAVLET